MNPLVVVALVLGPILIYFIYVEIKSFNRTHIDTDQIITGPNRCIFCGKKNLNNEHVFADWLKDILPSSNRTKAHISFDYGTLNKPNPKRTKTTIEYKSKPEASKERVVCYDCNRGWMSSLQNIIKPILTPLILDQDSLLTSLDQRKLTLWSIMSVMVGDNVFSPKLYISPKELHYFYLKRQPPIGYKLWIGRNNTPYKLNIFRDKIIYHPRTQLEDSGEKINASLFIVFIEHFMLILVSNTNYMNESFELTEDYPNKVARIYPKLKSNIFWSELSPLNKTDFENIIVRFQTLK